MMRYNISLFEKSFLFIHLFFSKQDSAQRQEGVGKKGRLLAAPTTENSVEWTNESVSFEWGVVLTHFS